MATSGSHISLSDYSDWMGNLPNSFHHKTLNSIAIPGSHDSFAYYLDTKAEIAPDTSQIIRDLGKIFGSKVKAIIDRWSVTQSCSFTEQLSAGIRYFDLRIATKEGSENAFFLHGLYSNEVETCLQEIKEFLSKHPKEIVFLDFNHFYNMSEFVHKQFLSMVLEVLGDKMCPLLDMDSVTLDMLWENNLQVLVFYDCDVAKGYLQFWPGSSIPSPWANTDDVNKLLQFLEEEYEKGRPADKFQVCQGVLTPSDTFVILHLMSSLKIMLCEKVAEPFVQWLKGKQSGSSNKGINICILDFVEMADYIPTVLALNKADD